MPFSGLRGGVQYDEVADGGDVIGKAAGFSSAMAVKCAIRVEMVSCIWGSMLVFLWIHLISTERAMLSAPPRYFSPKNFAASTAHNHCPQTTLLPSPFPPTKFFCSLHSSQSLSTNHAAAITLLSLLINFISVSNLSPPHPPISVLSVKTLFLLLLLFPHPCSENSFVQGVHCN